MVQEEVVKKFIDKRKEYLDEINRLDRQFSLVSGLRIVSFIAGVCLLLIGISDKVDVAGIAGALFTLIFIYLIKIHGDIVRNTDIAKSRYTVTERYIMRLGNDWRKFPDNGSEYLGQDNTVASDIDLLGADSLYQMINVCHTDKGKQKLAGCMRLENVNTDEIKRRNEAISELVNKNDFAVRFEAAGMRLSQGKKKFHPEAFEEYCQKSESGKLPVWAEAARWILPVVEVASLVLWIVGIVDYGFPLVGFLVLLAFSWISKPITDSVILPFYSVGNVVDDYLEMMEEVENEQFESELLNEFRINLCGKNGAMQAFAALRSIGQAYNVCFNPLVHQILCGFFLWDFQLAHFMSKWKKKYGNAASGCFECIAAFEELLSLSVVGVVRKTCWAQVDNECRIKAAGLYHPLIAPDSVIDNDASLKAGVTIITGSNMSGKTTFLRTVAINLALAFMGAPVCGDSLTAGVMKIFTSMRITDDVAHGISTFYAEILRIKTMAEYRKKNLPMICLIDEIFKGTNSADRIVGAKEVIVRLSGDNCITIVSTHDFELCDITDVNNNEAMNYHFEEHYENDELRFDYKMKDGRCTTTNARAILRLAGFDVSD